MILDTLDHLSLYFPINRGFKIAADYLAANPAATHPDGTVEIDGKNVFAIYSHVENARKTTPKIEMHRKYLDIHVVFGGQEDVGYIPAADCKARETEYNEENDYELFADAATDTVTLRPGSFLIVYPQDGHAPMSSDAPLHKVVFKILVDWP